MLLLHERLITIQTIRHYHPIGREFGLQMVEFTNVCGIPYSTDIRDFSFAKEIHHGDAAQRACEQLAGACDSSEFPFAVWDGSES